MDPSRAATEIFNFISHLSGVTAYGTIVGILLICGLGVPIPEDITLLAAGLLASSGQISLSGALLAGFFGVLIGDAILFFMGRKFGRKVFALPGLRRIFTLDRTQAAEARIRRDGPFICFIARFLPGLRSPVFAMAGALGVKRRTFFLLDGFAALISVPVWVYLGYWFGNNFDEAMKHAENVQISVFIALLVAIAGYVTYKIWKKKRRARTGIQTETPTETPKEVSVAPSVTELQHRERVGDSDTRRRDTSDGI